MHLAQVGLFCPLWQPSTYGFVVFEFLVLRIWSSLLRQVATRTSEDNWRTVTWQLHQKQWLVDNAAHGWSYQLNQTNPDLCRALMHSNACSYVYQESTKVLHSKQANVVGRGYSQYKDVDAHSCKHCLCHTHGQDLALDLGLICWNAFLCRKLSCQSCFQRTCKIMLGSYWII